MSDNAALLTNVFGKILRIDPLGNNSANGQYGIPADNPFVDGLGGNYFDFREREFFKLSS